MAISLNDGYEQFVEAESAMAREMAIRQGWYSTPNI